MPDPCPRCLLYHARVQGLLRTIAALTRDFEVLRDALVAERAAGVRAGWPPGVEERRRAVREPARWEVPRGGYDGRGCGGAEGGGQEQ